MKNSNRNASPAFTSVAQLRQRVTMLHALEASIRQDAFATPQQMEQLASLEKQSDFFGQCLLKLIGETQ